MALFSLTVHNFIADGQILYLARYRASLAVNKSAINSGLAYNSTSFFDL